MQISDIRIAFRHIIQNKLYSSINVIGLAVGISAVLLAIFIATPVAWLIMHQWLQGFAYRINIGVGIFAIADLIAISIALLAVSFQAIKAATANSVNNLRTD